MPSERCCDPSPDQLDAYCCHALSYWFTPSFPQKVTSIESHGLIVCCLPSISLRIAHALGELIAERSSIVQPTHTDIATCGQKRLGAPMRTRHSIDYHTSRVRRFCNYDPCGFVWRARPHRCAILYILRTSLFTMIVTHMLPMGMCLTKQEGAHPRGRAIIVRMGNDLQTHLSPFHKDSFSTTHGADAPDLCL